MRVDAGKSAREPSIARRHCCGQRAIEMQALTCGHVVGTPQMHEDAAGDDGCCDL